MQRVRDNLECVLKALLITIGAAYIFYKSIWGLIPAALVGIYVYKVGIKKKNRKRRFDALDEFKGMLVALQSAMSAGNSMERSLKAAESEVTNLYGKKSIMARELRLIEKKRSLNVSLDKAMKEMADRLDIKEIHDFVEVILAIRKTGGNAIKIIKDTVDRLIEGIELGAELEVMVAAKRLEQQVMIYMPSLVILFLQVTSKGFTDPLYGGVLGRIIMTVVLGGNVFADYLGKKIVDIDI